MVYIRLDTGLPSRLLQRVPSVFLACTWALNRPEPLGEFLRGGEGLYATTPPCLLGVVRSLLLSAYEGVLPLDPQDCAGLRASGPETGFYRRNPDPGG